MSKLAVRIWDLPTRLFHWLWVLCFAVAFISHESDRYLAIHVFAGYVFFALLLFRLWWGFKGSYYARFRQFMASPRQLFNYLRHRSQHAEYPGHNPAGGWAILLLLSLAASVAITGLLTLGLEEGHGPLFFLFNPAQAELWHSFHETLSFSMLALIALHITAVLIESLRRQQNLPRAMLSGYKQLPQAVPSVSNHRWLGLSLLILLLLSGAGYFSGYALDPNYRPFIGPELPDNPLWREECGSCHLAYHPVLLPERSWQALFKQQAQHFDEDLDLDTDTVQHLQAFHTRYAAEQQLTEAAYKILQSIPLQATPIRISQTPYWQEKHAALPEAIWRHAAVGSHSNCEACHLDADANTYEDAAMRLPNP